MTRTDITRALERFTGSPFIKTGDLCRYLGDKNHSRVKRKYLQGLECLPGKLYLCSEVASRLKENMTL